MSKSNKGKRTTGKGKSAQGDSYKFGFFFVLVIALLTFLVSSFLYSKYYKNIRPTKSTEIKEKIIVDLYFGDLAGGSLIKEKRRIDSVGGLANQAKKVILELIGGPKTDLTRTIPGATTLRNLSVNTDRIASVDFSTELTGKHTGGSSSELLTVYSIVNSLTLNFENIEKVQILVGGKKVETLAGHIYALRPLEANRGIVGD